jgi:ABC-type branched-subunit amino acid transport system substrate-binding protein/small-conductance mechanosensitive channel
MIPFAKMTKKQRFIGILAVLGVLTVLLSIITRITFIVQREEDQIHVAVVGPMSGEAAAIGRSLKDGAQLFVDTVNKAGGIGGNRMALVAVDDRNSGDGAAEAAARIAADARIQAVVGHWSEPAAAAAGAAYAEKRLPLLSPSPAAAAAARGSDWTFSLVFDDRLEARFLANYARNVLGHRLVSMIVDASGRGAKMAEDFEATYKRFGTVVRYTWTFDPARGDGDRQLKAIVDELKEKKDAGILFLAVGESDGAKLFKLMGDAGVRGMAVAPSAMATHAFLETLGRLIGDGGDPARLTNGTIVSAPLVFDTANKDAQNFRGAYQRRYGAPPDWVAAYAYDALGAVAAALKGGAPKDEPTGWRGRLRQAVGFVIPWLTDTEMDVPANRRRIRDQLARRASPERTIEGITGATWFNDKGEAQKPVLVGVYDGKNIISALTQLQPIKSAGGQNLIEELKQGRMLYVNDRFMYKTNVVYTGVQINEVADIDAEKNQHTLDFHIWFRFRGQFQPELVSFVNAVEPIKLEKPADEKQVGDMTYRLYHVKGKFRLDYTDEGLSYGTHLVGLSFGHAALNRNNLRYVVDELGLGLEGSESLLEKLQRLRVINPATGWVIEQASLSQQEVAKSAVGDPVYVGYGATEPQFSRIDYGVTIKKAQVQVRDFVPAEYFVYVGIFGVLGILFAIWMDRKEKGRFWAAQSWGLRAVSWPVSLLAVGNLALDFAFKNLPHYYIDVIIMTYDILWWFVPARILAIALERFVWTPLEDHTERTIPNVIRVFGSIAIYMLASFGVIAFVFEQHITSLLATSGLVAMIVGLAIQANISNVFSGIVINVERPFNVGDWVKIGEMDEGRVVDITWRTTRVKTRNGYVISVPNGKVSEAEVHNYNAFDIVRLDLLVQQDPTAPPEEVDKMIVEGLKAIDGILESPEREVKFLGIESYYGRWVAKYEVQVWTDNYARREQIEEDALFGIWREFRKHGIVPVAGEGPAPRLDQRREQPAAKGGLSVAE